MTTPSSPDRRRRRVFLHAAAAWGIGLVALTLSGWIGRQPAASLGVEPRWRGLLAALIMVTVVLAGVWWLQVQRERRSMEGLGLHGIARSAAYFVFGCALILGPTMLTVACIATFGWATVSINDAPGMAITTALAIATAFFHEALPEELLFRGYVYSTLNTAMRRWAAGVATTVLFVLVPVVSAQIQQQLPGMAVQVGNATHVTAGYVITVFVFGSTQQVLRMLTNSTWACVGFHLVFVLSNRIVGIRDSSWIRLSDVVSEGPMQMVFGGSALLIIAALLRHRRRSGRSLELSAVSPA